MKVGDIVDIPLPCGVVHMVDVKIGPAPAEGEEDKRETRTKVVAVVQTHPAQVSMWLDEIEKVAEVEKEAEQPAPAKT